MRKLFNFKVFSIPPPPFLVKLCVFYFKQCVRQGGKKSQPKKIVCKTMNFGSTN